MSIGFIHLKDDWLFVPLLFLTNGIVFAVKCFMKKYLLIILVLIAMVVLVPSCKKPGEQPQPPVTQPVQPQPAALDFTVSGWVAGQSTQFIINRKSFKTARWNFGDGSPELYTGPGTYTHVFAAGTYTVSLTVDDDSVNTVRKVCTFKPYYDFSVAGGLVTNDTLTFTAVAYPATGNTYNWSFGDGTTSSGAQPIHLYTTAGSYPVTLTVNNDEEYKVIKTLKIVKAAAYTRTIAGTRIFHNCQTVVHWVDGTKDTTSYGDSTVAITYLNGISLRALGETYTYNEDKSVGGIVYYWRDHPGGTIPSDPDPAYIIYDPVKDSISIKQTAQGTVHGSTPGSYWGSVFTGWWK